MVFPPSLFFLSVFLLTATTDEQDVDPKVEKINAYFEDLEANYKISGTASVSVDGTELLNKQIGIAFPDNTPKPNSETQYRVGSITKMFTAVIILQLVEERKLTLDTMLSEFFPNIQNADKITIEQMLRHMSGLDNLTDDPAYFTYYTEPQTRAEMIARIEQLSSDFEPGTKTEYSNTNFVLLGYIIEDVTGNTFADELINRITSDVGLMRTSYMTPSNVEQNVALSFEWENSQWNPLNETDPSVPHAAGAIMSTASELNVFIESLFAGKLINETSLETMTQFGEEGLGMGIFLFPLAGTPVGVGHAGGIDGFASILLYFLEEQVAVTIIGNGSENEEDSDTSISFNDVLVGLLNIVFASNNTDDTMTATPPPDINVTSDENTTSGTAATTFKSGFYTVLFTLLMFSKN